MQAICALEAPTGNICSPTNLLIKGDLSCGSLGKPLCKCTQAPPGPPPPAPVNINICTISEVDTPPQTISGTYMFYKPDFNDPIPGFSPSNNKKLEFNNMCYIEGSSSGVIQTKINRLIYPKGSLNDNNGVQPSTQYFTSASLSAEVTNNLSLYTFNKDCSSFVKSINKASYDLSLCQYTPSSYNNFCPSANQKITWKFPPKSQIGPCNIATICNEVCPKKHNSPLQNSSALVKMLNKKCNSLSMEYCKEVSVNNLYYNYNGNDYMIDSAKLECRPSTETEYETPICVPSGDCMTIYSPSLTFPPCFMASGATYSCKPISDISYINLPMSLSGSLSILQEQYTKLLNAEKIQTQTLNMNNLISTEKSMLSVHLPTYALGPGIATNLLSQKLSDTSNAWWLNTGLQKYATDIIDISTGKPVGGPPYYFSMYTYLKTILDNIYRPWSKGGYFSLSGGSPAALYQAQYNLLLSLSGHVHDFTEANKTDLSLNYIPSNIKTVSQFYKYILHILQNGYNGGSMWSSVNANGGWIIDSNIKDVIIIADIEPWLTSFTDIPHSYVDYNISINNNLSSSMNVPGKGGDKIQLTTTLDYKEVRPGWDNIINKSAIYQDIYPRYQDISLLYNNNDSNNKLIHMKYNDSSLNWDVDIDSYNHFQEYLLDIEFNNFDKGVVYLQDTSAICGSTCQDHLRNDLSGILANFRDLQKMVKYGLYSNNSNLRNYCKNIITPCTGKYSPPSECIIPSIKHTKKNINQDSSAVYFNCNTRSYNTLTYTLQGHIQYIMTQLQGAEASNINVINQMILTGGWGSWFGNIYPIWYWYDMSTSSYGSARKNEDHTITSSIQSDASLYVGGVPHDIPPPPPIIIAYNNNTNKYEFSLNKYNHLGKPFSIYNNTIRSYLTGTSYNYLLPQLSGPNYCVTSTDKKGIQDVTNSVCWDISSPFSELLTYYTSVLVPACQPIINWSPSMYNNLRQFLDTNTYNLVQDAIIDASITYISKTPQPQILYTCYNDNNHLIQNYNSQYPSGEIYYMANYTNFLIQLFDGSLNSSYTLWKNKIDIKNKYTDASLYLHSYNNNISDNSLQYISQDSSFQEISSGWGDWFNKHKTWVPGNLHLDPPIERIERDITEQYLTRFNHVSQKYFEYIYLPGALENHYYNDFSGLQCDDSSGLQFGEVSLKNNCKIYELPVSEYNDEGLHGTRLTILYTSYNSKITKQIETIADGSGYPSSHNYPSSYWKSYQDKIINTINNKNKSTYVEPSFNNNLYNNLYKSICELSSNTAHKNIILPYIANGGGEGSVPPVPVSNLLLYSNIDNVITLYNDLCSNNVNNITSFIKMYTSLNIFAPEPFRSLDYKDLPKNIDNLFNNLFNSEFASALQDIEILFYNNIVPLMQYKYGNTLTSLYINNLKINIEKINNYINNERIGIRASTAPLKNSMLDLQSNVNSKLGYRDLAINNMYNYKTTEYKDGTYDYIYKYIFNLYDDTSTNIANDISNLDLLYTTYSNSFMTYAYKHYVASKNNTLALESSFNSRLLEYALLVDISAKNYPLMKTYYNNIPTMNKLNDIFNTADISINYYFDKNLRYLQKSPTPSYDILYNDLSQIYSIADICYTNMSGEIQTIKHMLSTGTAYVNEVSLNCNTGSPMCIPNNIENTGIWYDVGKYAPAIDTSMADFSGISQFLLKNGAHKYNLAFAQLSNVMLCVYAKVLLDLLDNSTWTGADNFKVNIMGQFNLLLINSSVFGGPGGPLKHNIKDSVWGFFSNSNIDLSNIDFLKPTPKGNWKDPDVDKSVLLAYANTGYNTYKNGFIQLKNVLNSLDPSAELGVSFGGENASLASLDNLLYSDTFFGRIISQFNLFSDTKITQNQVIDKVVQYYYELIYGEDSAGHRGCDTSDYDLENCGFAGEGITRVTYIHWYQYIFFARLYEKLNHGQTQKLTLLGNPNTVDSIFNLISDGVQFFDAINIMGYGDGRSWYISASPQVNGNPINFNSQSWLNVICSEWIPPTKLVHSLDSSNIIHMNGAFSGYNQFQRKFTDYVDHLNFTYDTSNIPNYDNLSNTFKSINTSIQTFESIQNYMTTYDVSFTSLFNKLIMNYQDNTYYYDPKENVADVPWALSVKERVLDIFNFDITTCNASSVGRAAYYVNLMWIVDTLSWAQSNLVLKMKSEEVIDKLVTSCKDIHFWIDENKNFEKDLTKMNPNTLVQFTVYSILNTKLFSDSTTFMNNSWIDSSVNNKNIKNNIIHRVMSGNGVSLGCDQWTCRNFMWANEHPDLSWVKRNIPSTSKIHTNFTDLSNLNKIIGGWSNTNGEGTWDSCYNNTICLGGFGKIDNFGAGTPKLPSKFGDISNATEYIHTTYTNKWYTIGGEGTDPISFGDQAYTRMSIDIGGYWPAVDTSMGWKNAAWAHEKNQGYSPDWTTDHSYIASYDYNIKNKKSIDLSISDASWVNMANLDWITSQLFGKEISFNGICFDTESTGTGPPWYNNDSSGINHYTDPFIRAITGNPNGTWGDLGLIYSSMATFQIYVARRWMNMFGNKIKTHYNIPNFKFSCSPETEDGLTKANLYNSSHFIQSYLLFNKDASGVSPPSDSLEVEIIVQTFIGNLNSLVNSGISNKPFDYLIPQMYNNNLAYKAWDPFITKDSKNKVQFGDCSGNHVSHDYATCINNKLIWKNNLVPKAIDTIRAIFDTTQGNWDPHNVILTYESAAAYMYTFDPSVHIQIGKSPDFSNIIYTASGEIGLNAGWENKCIGTDSSLPSHWTQSFQDPSGIFWENYMELITGNISSTSRLQITWGDVISDISGKGIGGVLGWPAQEEHEQLSPAVDGINTIKLLSKYK
tara:strand:+ start:230 stop:8698 length:8469 start_codon:yes stop_codon:yes gene_type:complete